MKVDEFVLKFKRKKNKKKNLNKKLIFDIFLCKFLNTEFKSGWIVIEKNSQKISSRLNFVSAWLKCIS